MIDDHLKRSDFDLVFPWPHEEDTLQDRIRHIQNQNYDTQGVHEYTNRPFSKKRYAIHIQKGYPIVHEKRRLSEEWNQHLQYRAQLRKRASRSQSLNDTT